MYMSLFDIFVRLFHMCRIHMYRSLLHTCLFVSFTSVFYMYMSLFDIFVRLFHHCLLHAYTSLFEFFFFCGLLYSSLYMYISLSIIYCNCNVHVYVCAPHICMCVTMARRHSWWHYNHSNTQQHNTTHSNTPRGQQWRNTLQHTATHCNTLLHTSRPAMAPAFLVALR